MATGPLIVIVGQTASGKSDLALQLAERFDGEIICADSRTIYKGMDIGTAKPSQDDQASVPHHLLDVIEPGQPFTVADFKRLANEAIEEVTGKGKIPVLVGGSGLYVDAVLYDYAFSPDDTARDSVNPRHLVASPKTARTIRATTLVLGLEVPSEVLMARITGRLQKMVKAGLIEEAREMSAKYGWDIELMKTYLPLKSYLAGLETLDDALQKMVIKDRQLAKRQATWFKRNSSIHWLSDPRQAVDLVTTFLNKTP
jgi:tRNA dimethylallyltransferase